MKTLCKALLVQEQLGPGIVVNDLSMELDPAQKVGSASELSCTTSCENVMRRSRPPRLRCNILPAWNYITTEPLRIFNEQEYRPETMSRGNGDPKTDAAEEEIQMYYQGALTREELDEK